MENNITQSQEPQLKLNVKRTAIIGFAFFGILLLWQVYDSWCPTFLTELFKEALGTNDTEQVQYLVGMMMAIDNLAALIMLPIFGRLSDKTHTRFGKRMPYIIIGTFLCAIAFPFIPVLFHYHNLAGTIAVMAIVVFFAMMYRNPAVALIPDITPKPLRSKANGIINIMGYYQDCPIHLAHMPHKAVYGNLIHSRKRLIQQKYWLFTAKHTQHGYNLFLSSAQILYIRILLNMTDYLLWKIFLISIKIFQTIGAINADIILI